jgi:hypothetical protein
MNSKKNRNLFPIVAVLTLTEFLGYVMIDLGKKKQFSSYSVFLYKKKKFVSLKCMPVSFVVTILKVFFACYDRLK